MLFSVRISIIVMIMRCLMACSQWLPPSDLQTKFERVQNAPLGRDSAQASSNLDEQQNGFDRHIEESYNLAGPQPPEAQHPLGPFIAVSTSHGSPLVNNDQPHQTSCTLSGSDRPPPSRETEQTEHGRFGGVQGVSNPSLPSTTSKLTDPIPTSRRQCTMDSEIQRHRMLGGI